MGLATFNSSAKRGLSDTLNPGGILVLQSPTAIIFMTHGASDVQRDHDTKIISPVGTFLLDEYKVSGYL